MQSNLRQILKVELCHLLSESKVKIEHCVSQLEQEHIWWRPGEGHNSIGNLILHLSGNLRQWAICSLGNLEDLRIREKEFSIEDGIEKDKLLAELNSTVSEASQYVERIEAERWCEPIKVQGFQTTILGALMHTTSHFVGHTHQIVQLCRLQLGDQYRFHWRADSSKNSVPV